jgi:hypothetical protein
MADIISTVFFLKFYRVVSFLKSATSDTASNGTSSKLVSGTILVKPLLTI